MEGVSSNEKRAGIDLDTYLSALPTLSVIEGKVMEDENHLFYHWLCQNYPKYNNIDGVSLEELYLKKVLETGMLKTDFFRYCDNHNFPHPLSI